MKRIDFTNCPIVPGRAYNGANGKKISIEYEGKEYMLKFPSSSEKIKNELSYSNGTVSEHIGSSIYNMLGVEAQRTLLGTYMLKGKEKIVCACEDFTADGSVMADFCSIKNSVIDSETQGTGTELSEILESIENQSFVNPQDLLERFWDMFVIDTLLGNFDRHNGNWGILINRNTGESRIAPVFDCGSCVLPQADETIIKSILTNEKELNARVYTFPRSAIKYNGEKISYYDFLTETDNEECLNAIKRIVPRIDIEEIGTFIDDMLYISDLQKEFYKTYLNARYEKILIPVYDQVMEEDEDQSFGMTL